VPSLYCQDGCLASGAEFEPVDAAAAVEVEAHDHAAVADSPGVRAARAGWILDRGEHPPALGETMHHAARVEVVPDDHAGVVDGPHARALPGCGASVRVVDRGEPATPFDKPVLHAAGIDGEPGDHAGSFSKCGSVVPGLAWRAISRTREWPDLPRHRPPFGGVCPLGWQPHMQMHMQMHSHLDLPGADLPRPEWSSRG